MASVIEWTELKSDPGDPSPKPRSSHGVSVVKGEIYVYGGEHTARTPLPDEEAFWKFSQDSKKWTALPNGPSPRIAHAQAAIDECIYIFGGRAGITMNEEPLNDMWKFNTVTHEWSLVHYSDESEGSIPSPRSFHRMVNMSGKLFVFGGCGTDGRLNDLYEFNTDTMTWTAHPASSLRGRGGPNLIPVCNNSIMVVAGFAGEETNDGQVFDVGTSSWKDMNLSSLRPRSVCVSVALKEKALIFGGEVDPSQKGHEGAGGFENDVLCLSYDTHEIERFVAPKDESNWPAMRGWSAGDVFGEEVYIFGGLTGDDEAPERLGDLWKLRVISS